MREAVFNTLKIATGSGILALPYAVSHGGAVLGVLGLTVILLWNLWCINLQLECKEVFDEIRSDSSSGSKHGTPNPNRRRHHSDRSSDSGSGSSSSGEGVGAYHIGYTGSRLGNNVSGNNGNISYATGDGNGRAFHRSGGYPDEGEDEEEDDVGAWLAVVPNGEEEEGQLSTYAQLGKFALGQLGVSLVDLSLALTMLGSCSIYLIIARDMLSDTPFYVLRHGDSRDSAKNTSGILNIVLYSALVFPMTCFKSLASIGRVSLLGVLAMSCGMFAAIAVGIAQYGLPRFDLLGLVHSSALWPQGLEGLAVFFGAVVYSFGVGIFTFEIQESMEDPSEFPLAMRMSVGIVWVLYIVTGLGVSVIYRNVPGGVSDNFLDNLPMSLTFSFLRALASLGVLCTYPVTLLPLAKLVERAVHGLYMRRKRRKKGASGGRGGGGGGGGGTIQQRGTNQSDHAGWYAPVYATGGPVSNAGSGDDGSGSVGGGAGGSSGSMVTRLLMPSPPPKVPPELGEFSEQSGKLVSIGSVAYGAIGEGSDTGDDEAGSGLRGSGSSAGGGGGRNAMTRVTTFEGLNKMPDLSAHGLQITESRHIDMHGRITLWKLVLRLVLVIVTALLAIYCPHFGIVVSILGCFSVNIGCFILPPWFHLCILRGRLSTFQKVVDVMLLCVGVVSCVVTTVLALRTAWELNGNG